MAPARFALLLAFVCILIGTEPSSAGADDFYKGKTFTVIVGSTPGGSFNANARSVARHLGSYIPGNPTVVVQNMPGAGSLTAVRYLEGSAARDGTAMTVFLPGIITQSIVAPEKIKLDMSKYTWIGVVSPDYFRVCYGFGPDGVKSWNDLMRRPKDKPFIMGTTGTGASNYINGASLRDVLGVNLKIIMGFPGSTEIRLAVERGELDGDCGGFNSVPPDWIRDGKAHPFVRFSEKRAAGIPESAVYVGKFVKTEAQMQLLEFLYGADELGRPFIMSRQVPEDRVTVIRKAFADTMKDPAFRAEMEKQQLPVIPLTGDEAERIYQRMMSAPPAIVAKAKRIYETE
jgi:tripartite-type tricarboxylate transporter receptor subunit TctC